MRYDEFIKTVSERGGHDNRDTAVQATQIVLADLGQRLKGGETENLAAQLPEELKGSLTEHAAAEPVVDDVDDFLRRVAAHLGAGTDPEQARNHVAAVFATLSEAVSEGEIQNLRSQLPAGFGPLFK